MKKDNIIFNINLAQSIPSEISINIDGILHIKEKKQKYELLEFIDGTEGEKYVCTKKVFQLTINYMTEDSYLDLLKIWKSKKVCQIYEIQSYFARLLAPEIDLQFDYDDYGKKFRFGTIELKEA